jgi:hypothetical protein
MQQTILVSCFRTQVSRKRGLEVAWTFETLHSYLLMMSNDFKHLNVQRDPNHFNSLLPSASPFLSVSPYAKFCNAKPLVNLHPREDCTCVVSSGCRQP